MRNIAAGVMAAASIACAADAPLGLRERYDPEPKPTAGPDYGRGRYVYRDTKPAGPTDDQRKAKRKAQRAARRKNRK